MLLVVPRKYVVLRQQHGAQGKPATLASVDTLLDAKEILRKHVVENRGCVYFDGRRGQYDNTKVYIKRRRVDAPADRRKPASAKPRAKHGRTAQARKGAAKG